MQDICQELSCETRLRLPLPSGAGKTLKMVFGVIMAALAVLMGALAMLLCRSVSWALKTWSDLSIEEIVYHLKMPMEGTNSGMILDYIQSCVIFSICVATGLTAVFLLLRHKKKIYHITQVVTVGAAMLSGGGAVRYFWNALDISAYVERQNTYSSFIDDHYVNPAEVLLKFPKEKRNIIYIFLESMENTYADTEHGGAFDTNVIPELTELSETNENFSGDRGILNGGYALKGATWTMGAMFAQTSGVPLLLPIDQNSMGTQGEFFSTLVTLGDILEEEGYEQTLLIGSEAIFGGRKLYFQEHGNYQIHDYTYALNKHEIPEGYSVWWGYEDEKLFDLAKEQLNTLAGREQPFNLTMLTVDTHFEDGYVCELCQQEFGDDQYSNVMACSSRQVAGFVKWIQEQPFYENTTIVISGDHLTMDADYCENIPEDYERKVYTAYINAPVEPQSVTYREYSTFDQFPTTLASLGVEIPGNRLGLGTNLFSQEKTLVEQYGIDTVNNGLLQKSELMESLTSGLEQQKVKIDIAPYDAAAQQVTVTLSNVSNCEDTTEIVCAVWSDAEQKDLLWYKGQEQSQGVFRVNIPLMDFECRSGTYNLYVYSSGNEWKNAFMGAAVFSVETDAAQNLGEQMEGIDISPITVEIEVGEYDYHTGKFDVYIRNIMEDTVPISIRGAVWANEDQGDLIWYEAQRQEDGTYLISVYAKDFQFKETVYNIHVYAVDDAERSVLLGATTGKIT